MLSHAKPYYKKILPNNPPDLHPTEVTNHTCIVPFETDEDQFLKLIKSHYDYNGTQLSAKFNLKRLEQDVVKFYIAGKPLIVTDDSEFKIVFRFRNLPTEMTISGSK